MNRLRLLSRTALGISLWLIAAPLRLCPPGAHTPPLTGAPGSRKPPVDGIRCRAGLQGNAAGLGGRVFVSFVAVGGYRRFLVRSYPRGSDGGAAHSYSNAHCAPRDTPEEVTDKAHRPGRCGQRGRPLVPGVGVPRQFKQRHPHPQGERSHPGWPGWRDSPGVPWLQP